MKLMIIESPGKKKKLESILGDGWKVMPSVGHIRDLPEKEMGVEPPNFKPQYVLSTRGAEVVAAIKKSLPHASEVYLATDPDREGESIAWHLQRALGLENPHRVAFNEITESAVLTAIKTPRKTDLNLVAAQEARRVLDRLVGYMVSPALSAAAGQHLSAGRVQTPAVLLVVDRENEIAKFVSTNHYAVQLNFENGSVTWSADWITDNYVSEDFPYVTDKALAEQIAQMASVSVLSYDTKNTKKSPPPPFTTSTLQQAASVTFDLDPADTMAIAQRLYEQGHITYHRTDNPNISAESMPALKAEADKLGLAVVADQRTFPAPDGAQAGHPAITPTHWEVQELGVGSQEEQIYNLIRLRAIACQLTDAEYLVHQAKLKGADVQGKETVFIARNRVLQKAGWLSLTAQDQTDEDQAADVQNPMPALAAGQRLNVSTGSLIPKKTSAPKRYTKASLVKKLESEGIGRPSTYAAILDNIFGKGYIVAKGKLLYATPAAQTIIELLRHKFGFVDLKFTSNVESSLDEIAVGKNKYLAVVQEHHGYLQQEIASLNAIPPKHPCPTCGKALMHRVKGGKGGYDFWGCTGYPECTVSLPDDNGKPGARKEVPASNFACAKCGKPLARRTKKGKDGYDFWGCTGYKDGCKASYKNKNDAPVFTDE